MPLAPATKPVTGNARVLRPVVEVSATTVNRNAFDVDLRGAAITARKVIRTNLDASVITVEANHGRREYQLAVRVLDEVPVAPSIYDGTDRHSYYRRNTIAGVYLMLDRTVYTVADAEALIVAWESITTTSDRLTVRIPAAHQPAIQNAQRLLADTGKSDSYRVVDRGERLVAEVAEAMGALRVQTLVLEAVTGVNDRGIGGKVTPSELGFIFTGKAPDAQRVRDTAHGEAIEYVIAQRAEAAQQRYTLQQQVPALRDALNAALQADADRALAFYNTLSDLVGATDDDVVQRFVYGTEGSLHYAKVDCDRSRQAAQRLQQALDGLRWIAQDAVRQTVLAGEDY